MTAADKRNIPEHIFLNVINPFIFHYLTRYLHPGIDLKPMYENREENSSDKSRFFGSLVIGKR